MYNNAPLIVNLGSTFQDSDTRPRSSPPRNKIGPEPCLIERLPSTAFIQREAHFILPKAVIKQLRREPSPTVEEEWREEAEEAEENSTEQSPDDENVHPRPAHTRRRSVSSILSSISSATSKSAWSISSQSKVSKAWKDPEPYEVLRAIEKKDIMFLMEIRDRAFHLLVRKSGGATPLLHAMRIGQSHQDVAILLLGAFSRYVNQLQDEDISKPATKVLLKALRANLKLAIDFGLATQQSDLIASFLQTLIMSEGDKWVANQASSVGLALRAGREGKPVHTAAAAVRSFATKELGKAKIIAALEDYVANATADLLMIAAWSNVLDAINTDDSIPTYYFARDDRVYKAFCDRLDRHKQVIERKASRRLRWQLRVLRKVMEGRTTNYRSKVELLAEEFDEGEGV
ncbi:unnamed protein product [Somion occarium]|uniref:Ankyrin repeat protein n=1 Tax=Somion occarium TaxID=3059160 RepID=A0ABP1D2Q7_9APHY